MAVLRLNFIFVLFLICHLVLCDNTCYPPPGQGALTYTDGSFIEPNSVPFTFGQDAKLNISWDTIYPTSTLYMIAGCNWNQPLQLAGEYLHSITQHRFDFPLLMLLTSDNVAQTWLEWVVQPMSNNASETYAFRVVNPRGNAAEQAGGGFISAAFFISSPQTSSAQTSSSVIIAKQ
jgi:hypothetical protein